MLVGPPGAGKSAIGFGLARRLNRSFFDADSQAESAPDRLGRSTAADLDANREWLHRIGSVSTVAVIAAPWEGTEQIVRDGAQQSASGWWIVLLDAPVEVLQEHLVDEHAAPALIHSVRDYGEQLDRLRDAVHHTLNTGDSSVEELVDELVVAWRARCDGVAD